MSMKRSMETPFPYHICIVGAGAIGVSIAKLLSSQIPVSLWTRDIDKTSRLIKDKHVSIIDRPSSLPAQTNYWLCVKAYDIEALLQKLTPFRKDAPLTIL